MTTQIPVVSADRSGQPTTNPVLLALSPTAQMLDIGNLVRRALLSTEVKLFVSIFTAQFDANGATGTGDFLVSEIGDAAMSSGMVDTTNATVINATKASSGGWDFTLTADGQYPIADLAAYLGAQSRSVASVINHLVSVAQPSGAPNVTPTVHVDQELEAIYVEWPVGTPYATSGGMVGTSQALAGTSAAAAQWAE